MLLRYIVSNFMSIGHAVEFSMLPPGDSNDLRYTKQIKTHSGEWNVMLRAGFFGPNASGKSSLIKSIGFARDYVINGRRNGKGTGVNQYKGEIEELDGISSFDFVFYFAGEVYEYGFSINRKQVYEEWLYQLRKKNMAKLFTRTTDSKGKTQIEIGSQLAYNGTKGRQIIDVLKDNMQQNQKNQLFLSKLRENSIRKAELVGTWFDNLYVIYPDSRIRALPVQMKEDEELRHYIARMLGKMDTGVFDIIVASEDIDFLDFASKMNLPRELVEEIENLRNGILTFDGKYFVFSENEKNKTTMIQLKFQHRLNGHNTHFALEDESDGTQRLLDLLPILFMLERTDAVFFIDEIDRSLHTKLTQLLLKEFLQNNYGNNQLIFTAHDVNLINLTLFSQNELWFIEKTSRGESVLKPFSDFLDVKGDVVKAYLNGRFGAVPVIREMDL